MPARRHVFTPDTADGFDQLGRAGQAAFLAEVVTHKGVDTPLGVGLFGPSGSGKSFLLNRMMEAVGQISGAAAGLGLASPFAGNVVPVRVDASVTEEPATALTEAVLDALAASYPKLATEAMHAGGDPVESARTARDASNDVRRKLDTERQSLEALRGRHTRLGETVLFEAAGSRVDAYARSHRLRLERSLRGFGFNTTDPVTGYKDLVREAADAGGPLGRLSMGLRALWAYQGQARLIVLAVILGLVAWGAHTLAVDQTEWLSWLRGFGDKALPAADWAEAHLHWLSPIRKAATALAVIALAWNLVRAARFVLPIFKGVTLLRHDLEARRRDLNGLLAHQTRLVDGLAAEAETASIHADEAEQRASLHKAAGLQSLRLPGPDAVAQSGQSRAAAFFHALSASIGTSGAPSRVIVAIDGLDHLAPVGAAQFLQAATRLLGNGFVTVAAADRNRLATGISETDPALVSAELMRCVQLTYNVTASGASDEARSALVRRLLDGSTPEPTRIDLDAGRSTLDLPWGPKEADVLAALAPFAGDTPRSIKRFVNVYRVARADPGMRGAPASRFTVLALALALDPHGLVDHLLARPGQADTGHDTTLLRQALAAAQAAAGEPIDPTNGPLGLDVARHYSVRA